MANKFVTILNLGLEIRGTMWWAAQKAIKMKNKKEVWPVQNSSISAGWKIDVVVESGSANWAEKKARTLEK